jgi:hypothetical protein
VHDSCNLNPEIGNLKMDGLLNSPPGSLSN